MPASLMRYLRRCAGRGSGNAIIQAGGSSASADADAVDSAAAVAAAAEQMRALRRTNAVAALTYIGDYLECLGPLLHVSTD